jgi:Na+-translocating ferredoxin:NAD+ oxidoreductase RNF subunit RnfB
MVEHAHGFSIQEEACDGCLACMRACPTYAIRVKQDKARVLSELCVDCGSCLRACSRGAITATTRTLEEIGHFAYKVAVPSPVLFGQFPRSVRPEHIARGLLASGFDAVWDFGVELRLGARAIVDYVERWRGPRPLINITCPVAVRLVQVSYPRMVEQLVQVQLPREIAGREIKRRCSQERNLPPEQIAAIYVTPCQAKTISILQPAEGGRSYLDGSVGIEQVYNTVLAEARLAAESGDPGSGRSPARSAATLRWSTARALADALGRYRYLSVTGLPNVIDVFDDIEKGKLKDIDFLECYACWAGCANGNLTVDNVYVSLAKLQSLMGDLPASDPETEAEVARRYSHEDYSVERPFAPRALVHGGDLRERVRRVKEAERIASALPGLDCGLCGAPACSVLARDVAAGEAATGDCVFLSKHRLEELRRIHRHPA